MEPSQHFNLSKFFPGLGTALPPANASPSPVAAGNGNNNNAGASSSLIHDFATSDIMVIDEKQSMDFLKVNDIAKYPSPKLNRPSGSTFVTSKDLIAYGV